MANVKLSLTIKVAWWLRWYLFGVVLMARISGMEPDPDKLSYWISKGLTVEGWRRPWHARLARCWRRRGME